MGVQIEGSGKGNVANVGDDLKLQVLATSHNEEHSISFRLADAYVANTADTDDTLTIAAATDTPILYIENTSESKAIIIEKIISSSSVAGGVFKWIRNPTLGTIGANNTHNPVNLNFGSNRTARATVYNWDESGGAGMTGLSGGTVLDTFITNVGTTIHPIDGAIVLFQGDRIQFNYLVAGGGEFECGVRFYYDISLEE